MWYLLRARGVDVRLDPPPGQRPSQWPETLREDLSWAETVLVVASPRYRAEEEEPAELARRQFLDGRSDQRFIPLLLPGRAEADIPEFVANAPAVRIEDLTPDGLDSIMQILAAEPLLPPASASRPSSRRRSFVVRRPTPVPEDFRDRLAAVVEVQCRAEAGQLGLRSPEPMRIRWSSTTRHAAASAAAVAGWDSVRPSRLRLHGDALSLAQALRTLPYRRLVILGEPGSGKTTLCLLLALDLLRMRWDSGDDPVPVLVSAASWNPRERAFESWLTDHLNVAYGLRSDVAGQLINARYILPIIDGLDEMAPSVRSYALVALNQITDTPLVVSCRTWEYAEIVDHTGPLGAAAVVEIEPIDAATAIRYLSTSAWRSDRWVTIFEHLQSKPKSPVAAAFSNPFMLSLARSVYRSPQSDPRELLSFPSPVEVESRLLDGFLDIAYGDGGPAVPRYRAVAARRGLEFLAAWLHRQGTRDLAWWDLHRAVSAAALRALVGVVGGALGAIVLTVVVLLLSPFAAQAPGGYTAFWPVAGAASGMGTALLWRRPVRPRERVGRWWRWVPRVRGWGDTPIRAMREDRALLLWTTTSWLFLGGLTGVLLKVIELRASTVVLGAVAIAYVLVLMSLVLRSAWFWFALAVPLLAARGTLPIRVLPFLEDAYHRQILRRVGRVYQFRHTRIQDYLVMDSRKAC